MSIHYVGEYKTILQLVGVLSHGKVAKRLTDYAIDQMQDVQNLRKAIFECVVSYRNVIFRLPLIIFLLYVQYTQLQTQSKHLREGQHKAAQTYGCRRELFVCISVSSLVPKHFSEHATYFS